MLSRASLVNPVLMTALVVRATNIRVVLGLNGQHGPRRLARTLLADPLASEQHWEKQLTADDYDERAILLR